MNKKSIENKIAAKIYEKKKVRNTAINIQNNIEEIKKMLNEVMPTTKK